MNSSKYIKGMEDITNRAHWMRRYKGTQYYLVNFSINLKLFWGLPCRASGKDSTLPMQVQSLVKEPNPTCCN